MTVTIISMSNKELKLEILPRAAGNGEIRPYFGNAVKQISGGHSPGA
jgi:hypothetical protein